MVVNVEMPETVEFLVPPVRERRAVPGACLPTSLQPVFCDSSCHTLELVSRGGGDWQWKD